MSAIEGWIKVYDMETHEFNRLPRDFEPVLIVVEDPTEGVMVRHIRNAMFVRVRVGVTGSALPTFFADGWPYMSHAENTSQRNVLYWRPISSDDIPKN